MPRNDRRLRRTWSARCAAVVAAVMLSGCVQPGPPQMRVDAQANPVSLIDSYLITHGMAISYVRSGRASRTDIIRLAQYDRAAMVAVGVAALQPDDRHDQQAEHALQALVDFTGDNDLRPDAAGQPGAATP